MDILVVEHDAQLAELVGSELTIDKDCPATAPANADESSMDCRSAKNGSASYVSNLLSSVDSKL
jgi:hypothetical protein